jgi:hypothetical protein
MKFFVMARVSGGVTGTREAAVKAADGRSVRLFDTRDDAAAYAADLNRRMNHTYSTASFRYWVEEAQS